MTGTQIAHWIGWISLCGGGLAFVSAFAVMVIQPAKSFRWVGLCFSGILVCVGNLFMLGAWQTAVQKSQAMSGDWRIGGGIALWLFAMLMAAGFWFGDKKRSDEEASSEQFRTCTSHARSVSVLSVLGGLAAAGGNLATLVNHVGESHEQWIFGGLFIVGQLPATLRGFVFLPRCASCGNGRMKAISWRPVRYRCKSCGTCQETDISIGSSRSSA